MPLYGLCCPSEILWRNQQPGSFISEKTCKSSWWGEERATGASDRRILSGTGRGKVQNQKEGSGGDHGGLHSHPGYTGLLQNPEGVKWVGCFPCTQNFSSAFSFKPWGLKGIWRDFCQTRWQDKRSVGPLVIPKVVKLLWPLGPVCASFDLKNLPHVKTTVKKNPQRGVRLCEMSCLLYYVAPLPCRCFTEPLSVYFLLDIFLLLPLPPPSHCPIFVRNAYKKKWLSGWLSWQPEWMNKHSICHRICPQVAVESTIQGLDEPMNHGPCWRPSPSQNPNAAFLRGPESQICNAEPWSVFLKEPSPMKAFIVKMKLFNWTEERVSGDSGDGGRGWCIFFVLSS